MYRMNIGAISLQYNYCITPISMMYVFDIYMIQIQYRTHRDSVYNQYNISIKSI